MEINTSNYKQKISGVLSCYNRIVITGTPPSLCYSQGITGYFHSQGIRIFDYPKFAEPYKEGLRNNAEAIANKNGINIEHIRKSHIRKEEIVQQCRTQKVRKN